MLIFAGIDEAGYGPVLGPLCVACSVFVLEDADPAEGPPNLWARLGSAVCRKASDRKRRVAVDDSKNLKGANDGPSHPLRHLERGVLSFCPGESPPATDAELFEVLSVAAPERPWYAAAASPLPLAQTAAELGIARGRVGRALGRAGVDCALLACEAIDADAFNREVRETGSKAVVNFRAAVRLIERVWQRWPDAHPRIMVDRHGGRIRYAEELARAFPGARLTTVGEASTMSRYRLERDGSGVTISFATEGDGRFLPIALASMTAKYVRELHMLRLNRFFRARMPELKPTAGYFKDGRRYLREIAPVIRSLGIGKDRMERIV